MRQFQEQQQERASEAFQASQKSAQQQTPRQSMSRCSLRRPEHRFLTRRERYSEKLADTVLLPVELVAINFSFDENLGFLVRAAGCFGASCVSVIGSLPDRSKIKASSGSLVDFVKLRQYKNTFSYLEDAKARGLKIVAIELCDKAVDLSVHQFDFGVPTALIVGNEQIGIPGDVIAAADDVLKISMPGVGFCLNTSQAANIVLYEYSRQWEHSVQAKTSNINLGERQIG
ncbi:MAG TPA: TrmH family RNA methyltransferase [Dehalococcoidia bacterium]|nr:TrmH family RNA methyltransferase [Dehalococcoidia bacterium]